MIFAVVGLSCYCYNRSKIFSKRLFCFTLGLIAGRRESPKRVVTLILYIKIKTKNLLLRKREVANLNLKALKEKELTSILGGYNNHDSVLSRVQGLWNSFNNGTHWYEKSLIGVGLMLMVLGEANPIEGARVVGRRFGNLFEKIKPERAAQPAAIKSPSTKTPSEALNDWFQDNSNKINPLKRALTDGQRIESLGFAIQETKKVYGEDALKLIQKKDLHQEIQNLSEDILKEKGLIPKSK